MRRAELAAATGEPIPAAATYLERDFPKLPRAVKVAEILARAEEQEPRFEIFVGIAVVEVDRSPREH